MLPCWDVPPLDLGVAKIYPFAVLVALGVVIAHWWAVRYAARSGLRADIAARLGWSMVAAGFAGAWLFRLAYQPGWPHGIASFGGIFGGLAGAWIWSRSGALLPYLDGYTRAFPIGLAFGRAGCTLVHDHLGRSAPGAWFTRDCGGGPRYDLGLIELVFLSGAAIGLACWPRQSKPSGRALGSFLLVYGSFRFWLDGLHQDPPRWLWWPVDRWAACALAVLGAALIVYRAANPAAEPLR